MKKVKKCFNCKFAGKQFRIDKLTHLHCINEEPYPDAKWKNGELSAWDTLKKFGDTCEKHEEKLIFKKQRIYEINVLYLQNENTNKILTFDAKKRSLVITFQNRQELYWLCFLAFVTAS